MKALFKKLRHRSVFTVGTAYVVVAWILLQVAATIFPIYDTPEWILKAFTTLLFLGFPIALVLAWVFDLTPGGIKRTPETAEPETNEQAVIELPTGPSIAVLPFRNLSNDPAQDLFAQALGGDVITGLTQSSHLFVLTAGTTADIQRGDQDIVEIGKKLGVSYLLDGSVRTAGDTLRVSARLLDASNGVQIWSQNYDRQLSAENLFSVQDDIREQIVATLSDLHGVIYSTQGAKSIKRPTSSLNAYECLSVALAYDKYLSAEYHLRARESLERAIEIDPEFDEAWAHLSWIYTDEHVWGYNPLPNSMERALDAAKKAIRLSPVNYHSHWLLSRVYYFMGDIDRFLAESRRALILNSSDGTTLGLIGMYTAFSGDWDLGIEMMSKAKLLNPNYPDYYHLVFGSADFHKGNYQGALEQLQKMNLPEFAPGEIFLAATYSMLDRKEEAARHCESLELQNARLIMDMTFPFQPELCDRVVKALSAAGLSDTSPEFTPPLIADTPQPGD